MRRFCRIFWTTFAGVSLLLCVAVAGVWVRSYWVDDHFSGPVGPTLVTVNVAVGRIAVRHLASDRDSLSFAGQDGWEHRRREEPPLVWKPRMAFASAWDANIPGLAYAHSDSDGFHGRLLVIHLAYPTALFALAPLAWAAGFVRRRRQKRRERAGLCEQCGYDLRASPGRCPECGAVPAR